MTALSDIRAAIARHRAERRDVPLFGRQRTLLLEIGDSAYQGVYAETLERPLAIDDVPIVRTKEFRGWALVER
jgi:hypothetical protein